MVRTGDAYAYTDHFDMNVTGTANGLNQLTQVGSKSLTHDANGNVTMFGTRSFTYSSENLLLTGPNSTTLSYDPAMRLYQTVASGTTTRMAYDGLDRIAEYDGADVLKRRYVHGPGMDQPLVWYEGSGTSDRRFLSSDERGSIISVADSSGALLRINRYDEYGNPQGTNLGVWGYTGHAWLPGMGGWYYKARIYDRELGRFLQADPIGYAGGLNLYAYVRNDPVNFVDPLGLNGCSPQATVCGPAGVRVFVASSYFGNTQNGFDAAAFFADLDSREQLQTEATCAGNPNCPAEEPQEIVVVAEREQPHNPAAVNQTAIDYIRQIQACRTPTCSAQAWAEYDAFRKTSAFELERAKNYDRQELIWTTLKAYAALYTGWGTSILRVMGLWGVGEAIDHGGRCAVRGGNC